MNDRTSLLASIQTRACLPAGCFAAECIDENGNGIKSKNGACWLNHATSPERAAESLAARINATESKFL